MASYLVEITCLSVVIVLVARELSWQNRDCKMEYSDMLKAIEELTSAHRKLEEKINYLVSDVQRKPLAQEDWNSTDNVQSATGDLAHSDKTVQGAMVQEQFDAASLYRIPGGSNCSRHVMRRADQGLVYAIDPACFVYPLLNIHIWQSVFSDGLCRRLIRAAEQANSWTRKSRTLQGEDVGLEALHLSDADTNEIESLVQRLGTFIVAQFLSPWPELDGLAGAKGKKAKRRRAKFNYAEVPRLKGTPFIIRYDAEKPTSSLERHKDNSDISFIILLSDPLDFDAGGTEFDVLGGETLPVSRGDAAVFSGQLIHKAKAVTRGRRYVLSGFITYQTDFIDLKRRGTLATTMYQH